MSWSAKQYVAFEDERTRPVRDLLSALPDIEARSAMDLGCGPGNSTEVLAARFPDAVVRGLDSSSDMIDAARRRLPNVQFEIGGIEEWKDPGPFDVILANAVLQWVPDHAGLLPKLVAKLASGGGLAIQMPDNLDGPAHRLMREVAADGPWAHALAGASAVRTPIGDANGYYELLRALCTKVDIWRTTYHHPMRDGAAYKRNASILRAPRRRSAASNAKGAIKPRATVKGPRLTPAWCGGPPRRTDAAVPGRDRGRSVRR